MYASWLETAAYLIKDAFDYDSEIISLRQPYEEKPWNTVKGNIIFITSNVSSLYAQHRPRTIYRSQSKLNT